MISSSTTFTTATGSANRLRWILSVTAVWAICYISLTSSFVIKENKNIARVTSCGDYAQCHYHHHDHPRNDRSTLFRLHSMSSESSEDNDNVYNNNNNDNDDNDDDDDDFMASLKSRMGEVSERENKLPLVVLDCMLPRQVLRLQVKNLLLNELVQSCIHKERPFFGMMGMARLKTGEPVHLKRGVEVEILNPKYVEESGGVQLELRAGRRFEIVGNVDTAGGGWTEAKVDYLDFAKEEEAEIQEAVARVDDEDGTKEGDRLAVARAISKASQLTSPNLQMKDSLSLIDRWIVLATEREREPNQIQKILEDLGERPPIEEPSNLAFWVGALINPLPAMGVATEIRPALLTAKTAEARVQIAVDGILKSIKHMEPSDPSSSS